MLLMIMPRISCDNCVKVGPSANVPIAFFTFLCFSQAYFLLIAYFHLFLLSTFLHTFYELITYVNLSTLLLAGIVNRLQLIMIGCGQPQSTKQKQ